MTHPNENPASETTDVRVRASRIKQTDRATREMAEAITHGAIPASARDVASESVRRTHEAYDVMSNGANERASEVQRLMLGSHSHATAIINQMTHNMTAQSNAVFDAWAAVARARSLPDVAEVQANFVQGQVAMLAQQSQELFQLALEGLRESLKELGSSAHVR